MKNQPPICKILTVDDQMGIGSVFYDFFTIRNYEVLCAMSGKEAIEIVKKDKPRIVLLDINMRGMDGIETLKKIKEIDKDVFVIMVTGEKDDDTLSRATQAGADSYITKPLSMAYLERVVLSKFIDLSIRDIGRDFGAYNDTK